jgi:hypothetical protein
MNVLGSTTYMYTIFNTNTKLLIWALTYSRSVTHTYVRVTNGADHSVAQVGVVGIHAHELTSWMCCHDGFVPTSVQQWSNDKIPRESNTFSCYPWLGRKHGGGIRGRGYRVPCNCLLQQYYVQVKSVRGGVAHVRRWMKRRHVQLPRRRHELSVRGRTNGIHRWICLNRRRESWRGR